MSYHRFGLRSDHRKAMLRNAVTSLLETGRITTTETRAKDIKRLADQMITLGKRGDLHARRQAIAYLTREDVVQKLFTNLADKYTDRQGGYTRVIKAGYRRGDGAPMAIVELVD
ncbi:MAG: 50S ribosomal protein L17 [Syntrophomonadaceae bacterium]|nr:50S ribosomal protein L17 [Bacillota bacterium]NLM89275.1 50S ribosomal protein L17 [Syntrophomonadaceae bacterium]HQA49527.1 50S ribosomal protein L17 [Syntrophomonadaceae bacterium]HQD90452.1 50S ribosomal protein L17 [Syntrophomonadaceae bacterium]